MFVVGESRSNRRSVPSSKSQRKAKGRQSRVGWASRPAAGFGVSLKRSLAAREVRERERPSSAGETPTLPGTASTWSSVLGDYTLTHFKQSKELVSQTYRKVLSVKLSVRSV